MGIVFKVFTSVAGFGSLLLCALALTAGLYMLADFAEEYPSVTGRILKGLIYFIISMYAIFYVDGMPWKQTLAGIVCHLTYYLTLSTFPFIEIFSVKSLASVIAIIVSHYFWFEYFMEMEHQFSMHQILGFFIVMVWAVPVGLLISLTINENVLPSSRASEYPADGVKKRATVYVSVVDFFAGIFRNFSEMIFPAKGKALIGGSKYGGKKSY